MWILCKHYYRHDGTIHKSTFEVYKVESEVKLQAQNIIEKFKEEAEQMIKLYNEKQIISDIYKNFDTCEIENILESEYEDKEEKFKYLTKTCYCCFGIFPLKVDLDADMILEYTDYR